MPRARLRRLHPSVCLSVENEIHLDIQAATIRIRRDSSIDHYRLSCDKVSCTGGDMLAFWTVDPPFHEIVAVAPIVLVE